MFHYIIFEGLYARIVFLGTTSDLSVANKNQFINQVRKDGISLSFQDDAMINPAVYVFLNFLLLFFV